MSMEDDYRNETVTYWAATGRKDKFNKPILSSPIELLVRWEDRNEVIYGRVHAPVSIEATLVVDRRIPEESVFWRGLPEDYDAATSTDLMRVEKFTDVPDIKGIEHRRLAYLCRYGDTLPGIEAGTGSG